MSENPMSLWQNLPHVTNTRIPKPPFYDDTYGKPYRELPLENERSIRLLVLQPAKNKDQHLFCEIMHASLDEPPFYEAFSCTWDSEIPQAFLTCPDGSQILATLNCEAALRRLRFLPRPRCLWVDAICMNQYKVDERNTQVAMMAEIYQSAANVVIWLGPGDAQTDLAFKYLARAQFIWYYFWKQHSRSTSSNSLFSYRMLLTGQYQKLRKQSCSNDPRVSLLNLCFNTNIFHLLDNFFQADGVIVSKFKIAAVMTGSVH
ncbi:heterokaryon incompatibility protein-domain-containing protein [Halenospora varia]|nr:heterokaryon incompatibility protein-domain-containing protein [Halenospora varia]